MGARPELKQLAQVLKPSLEESYFLSCSAFKKDV